MDSSINNYNYSYNNSLIPLVLIELIIISFLFLEKYVALAGLLGIGVAIVLILVPRYALFLSLFIAYSGVAASVLQGLFLPAVLLTVVAWLIDFLRSKEFNFKQATQNGLFFLFLLWMLFSTLYAKDIEASFSDIYAYVKYLICYFLIVNILNSWSEIRELLWILILTGIFMLFYGIYIFMTSTEFMGVRLVSFIDDPNSFAIRLVPMVVFCYVLFKVEKHSLLKFAAVIAGLIIVSAIVLTFSRGGWLSLITVFGLIIWEEMKNRKKLLFSIAFVAIIITLIFLPEDLLILRFGKSEKLGLDVSIIQRLRILEGGVQMFFDHPILGVGVGNFITYCADYSGIIIGLVAHNSFLHVAAEMGIIGLVIFVWLFIETISNLKNAARHVENSKNIYYVKGVLFSLIGFTVHSMFLSEQYNITLFLLIGLTVVIKNIILNTQTQNTNAN